MRAGEGEMIWALGFPGNSSSVGNFMWKLKSLLFFFFLQQFKNKAQKTMNMAPEPGWIIVYSGDDTKSISPLPIDDLFQ